MNYVSRQDAKIAQGERTAVVSSLRSLRLGARTGFGLRARGAVSAAAGEDRQVPELAILPPAKTPKSRETREDRQDRQGFALAIFRALGDLGGLKVPPYSGPKVLNLKNLSSLRL